MTDLDKYGLLEKLYKTDEDGDDPRRLRIYHRLDDTHHLAVVAVEWSEEDETIYLVVDEPDD